MIARIPNSVHISALLEMEPEYAKTISNNQLALSHRFSLNKGSFTLIDYTGKKRALSS